MQQSLVVYNNVYYFLCLSQTSSTIGKNNLIFYCTFFSRLPQGEQKSSGRDKNVGRRRVFPWIQAQNTDNRHPDGSGRLLQNVWQVWNGGHRRLQVWSLTQFYSVDFSQSRIGIRVYCWQTDNQGVHQLFSRCPGAFEPSIANVVLEVMHKSRILEGRCVISKSPSCVWDGDLGVAERNVKEKHFSDKGSLIWHSSIILFAKGKLRKIELVVTPGIL